MKTISKAIVGFETVQMCYINQKLTPFFIPSVPCWCYTMKGKKVKFSRKFVIFINTFDLKDKSVNLHGKNHNFHKIWCLFLWTGLTIKSFLFTLEITGVKAVVGQRSGCLHVLGNLNVCNFCKSTLAKTLVKCLFFSRLLYF